MATGGQKRTRLERVAALELPPGSWERVWNTLCRGRVLTRIGMSVLTAVALCVVMRGWHPPFSHRAYYVPARDVIARVQFSAVKPVDDDARDRARRQARYVYVQDPQPLAKLSAALLATVREVMAASAFQATTAKVWADFQPMAFEPGRLAPQQAKEQFDAFRKSLAGDKELLNFQKSLQAALAPFQKHGLLEKLPQKPGQGNHEEIIVYPLGQPAAKEVVKVSDVVIGQGEPLRESLLANMPSEAVAEATFHWLRRQLPSTLKRDDNETKKAVDAAVDAVKDQVIHYEAGQVLAEADRPLEPEQMRLLRLEYEAAMAQRPWDKMLGRATAVVTLILALFALCAVYIHHREPNLMDSLRRLALIQCMTVVTVLVAIWASADGWRAELVPVLLFGQTVAIAYRQELALRFCAIIALILALAMGHGMPTLLMLLGVTATAVLQLSRIRSRDKLIHVGLFSGLVAFLLWIVLGVLDGQSLGQPLLMIAGYHALWTIATGFLMTGLLPFVEHLFGVLTDMSLLELGDVSLPLLQELVRRAPATYNHSITVGSIAEAAADAIGARGLLARVGAYYHDIGKMLKPGYFIENQSGDGNRNRHESLVPAMSTLVIIAHVKDGADLARQHGLPQSIIDFIEQHHGTTLVEYFFGRANEQHQANPDSGDVEESDFRYPGPKPQTKEAGVLMLADCVESASRSLVDPAPSRIESLVREIAERRLDDGQFDESGLTLRELRTIEDNMIKSLIANYHGRVKYPDQKTA